MESYWACTGHRPPASALRARRRRQNAWQGDYVRIDPAPPYLLSRRHAYQCRRVVADRSENGPRLRGAEGCAQERDPEAIVRFRWRRGRPHGIHRVARDPQSLGSEPIRQRDAAREGSDNRARAPSSDPRVGKRGA